MFSVFIVSNCEYVKARKGCQPIFCEKPHCFILPGNGGRKHGYEDCGNP